MTRPPVRRDPARSSTTVFSPSDAAYTAAAMPAGPAPITAKSTASVGQSRQMPAQCARLGRLGFNRIFPSVHSIAGVFVGEPSRFSMAAPLSSSVSNQVNGTKFLYRNSRTIVVSRQLPGPTTFIPEHPTGLQLSRGEAETR